MQSLYNRLIETLDAALVDAGFEAAIVQPFVNRGEVTVFDITGVVVCTFTYDFQRSAVTFFINDERWYVDLNNEPTWLINTVSAVVAAAEKGRV